MSITIPRLKIGQIGSKHINAILAAIETALNGTFTGTLPIAESDVTGLVADLAAKQAAVIPTSTTAGVPPAATNAGKLIRVSEGDTGNPGLAVSDGTHWNRVVIGAAIASS